MDITSASIIDPRALLDTNAVEAAAQAVVTALQEDTDDDWEHLDEDDQAEVRMIVRTAVSSYLLALETGKNDGN